MAFKMNGSRLDKKMNVVEQASDCEIKTEEIDEDVHSIFSPLQKRLIVLTASTAALLSPLSSNIYLPALNLIASDLHVSDSLINLTVTSYLIFQALSPMVVAGFSDNAGRRPAYIACFTLYLGANLALTMQTNYTALLVLRCFQSAGSSAMVALCQGVVADVATAADRGTYVAYASVSTILGPTVSPILGGLLSQYLGWRAIFWFLAMFASPVFVFVLLFLPETCHKVVGNGSISPPTLIHMTLLGWLRQRRRYGRGMRVHDDEERKLVEEQRRKFPNPLATLKIFSTNEAPLLMGFVGMVFGVHYLVLSTIPSQYGDLYNLDEIYLGLIYIPYGLGSIVSAFTTGRLANWNYRRHASRLHFPISANKQTDLTPFPIERARLEIALPILYFISAAIAIYGWSLNCQVHLIALLVLLFAIGYGVYALYQVTAILIIDIYPENPATATAANNLVRCSFAAVSTACAVPLVDSLGVGWAYTFAACTALGTSLVLWILIIRGPSWRCEEAIVGSWHYHQISSQDRPGEKCG